MGKEDTTGSPFFKGLDGAVEKARNALLGRQHADGYWCFELEADCTIPAEYVIMMHFMDEIDPELECQIAKYLRARQESHGGWPLFTGGKFDLSCSVKTYLALKLVGDSPEAPHMAKARKAILDAGGAARSNVFTRITLALFEQLPWRGVPFMPVEIILLPRWSPFHLRKVSYWSRTVMTPLLVLCTLKPKAKNPRQVNIRELFVVPPEEETDYFPIRSKLNYFFLLLDKAGRKIEPFVPGFIRRESFKRAENWVIERLNGTYGLGAIFPAMVNAHEALSCLGYGPDHELRKMTAEALRKLLFINGDSGYCQPCVSPVWDTALSCLALLEDGDEDSKDGVRKALEWLRGKQLFEEAGDWREAHPDLKGGGWAFQFQNPHYPDLDDTAVVAWAMHLSGHGEFRDSVQKAADWISGMQSRNGGFASFDSDNTHYYLNEIPFADHGALLDPPTSDVSARCCKTLSMIGHNGNGTKAAYEYLRREQENSGAWFGRWGTNYIYGTWSALVALQQQNDPRNRAAMEKGAVWLKSKQRADGSWGEDCESYFDANMAGEAQMGTSFQTAWAILGLIAAGEGNSKAVRQGIRYLIEKQNPDGEWNDDCFTAPGFPRVFYLKYHGYSTYFPYWALAAFRSLKRKQV